MAGGGVTAIIATSAANRGSPLVLLHGGGSDASLISWGALAHLLADRLAHCRYVEFTGGGHSLPREIPELAAERLAAFFTDAETAAAVAPERERVNLGEA